MSIIENIAEQDTRIKELEQQLKALIAKVKGMCK